MVLLNRRAQQIAKHKQLNEKCEISIVEKLMQKVSSNNIFDNYSRTLNGCFVISIAESPRNGGSSKNIISASSGCKITYENYSLMRKINEQLHSSIGEKYLIYDLSIKLYEAIESKTKFNFLNLLSFLNI
jgi:hypothetical protein